MSAAGEIAEVKAAGAEASAVAAAEAAALVTAAADLEAARVAREAEESLEDTEEDLERAIASWQEERNLLQANLAALGQALSALPTAEQVAAMLLPLLDRLTATETELAELKSRSLPAATAEVITENLQTPPQGEGEGAHREAEQKPPRFHLL